MSKPKAGKKVKAKPISAWALLREDGEIAAHWISVCGGIVVIGAAIFLSKEHAKKFASKPGNLSTNMSPVRVTITVDKQP